MPASQTGTRDAAELQLKVLKVDAGGNRVSLGLEAVAG